MKLCVNALKGSTVWSQERSVTAAPNRLWMTDINAGATWDGNLCLASVIDSSGREVVGWSIRNEQGAEPARVAAVPAAGVAGDRADQPDLS